MLFHLLARGECAVTDVLAFEYVRKCPFAFLAQNAVLWNDEQRVSLSMTGYAIKRVLQLHISLIAGKDKAQQNALAECKNILTEMTS